METGSFLIEVSNPISQKPLSKKQLAESEESAGLDVVYDCDAEEDEVTFELVYTEDMVKKSKKWLDGYIVYRKENEMVRFYYFPSMSQYYSVDSLMKAGRKLQSGLFHGVNLINKKKSGLPDLFFRSELDQMLNELPRSLQPLIMQKGLK